VGLDRDRWDCYEHGNDASCSVHAGHFLTSCGIISLSRRTLVHGVKAGSCKLVR
jgi:hypothetical protein